MVNSFWWQGSSSGDLPSVDNPFILIDPRSTKNLSGTICYGAVDWSKYIL